MTWPTSNPIARELDDFWKETQSLWQQWWVEADLDTKMATGQQDYWNNYYGFNNYRNQKQLQFNKILRILNMIGGYQRDGRLATAIAAGDNDPDMGETAEQRTKVLNWSMDKDSTYEKISDCFDGANTSGLNLLHCWMDFREDPENGCLRTDRIPFSAFIMDNYWTKPDLSDCDKIWTRKYITKEQLKGLFPDIGKDINYLGKGYSSKDGKFQYLAQNWYQYTQEMYAYDEYWKREFREGRKILDTSSGEVVDWNGTKEQFQMLKRFNPNVKLIKAQIPTIKLYVLVNNHLIYEEQSPWGLDRFPFVPFVCYHYPEVQNYAWRYQGIVRNIRDSQVELNRRRNRLLDIMDAQVQSGLMVKEDALVNPEDAFFQGPGKVLYFKNTANLATDVAPIPPPPVAQGWMELIASIEEEIMSIVGPEELFAQNMGAKEMTGVLMKLKQGAGLTGLRNIFDRLNQSQIYLGEIMDDLIVKNFSQGKVKQILGEDPTELFFEKTFSKFQAKVEETELTSTQRQLQFMQALQMKQFLSDPNAISDDYLIEKSNLQDKKGIIERIKQREQQQQQQQQMQMQQQMEQQAVLTRSLEAKAQSDFAGAEERQARAASDIALAKERTSQSIHDRAAASLDNAKALKELESMEEDRLIKLANFVVDLQARQKALAGNEEGDSIEESEELGSDIRQAEMDSRTPSQKQTEQPQSGLAQSLSQ